MEEETGFNDIAIYVEYFRVFKNQFTVKASFVSLVTMLCMYSSQVLEVITIFVLVVFSEPH